MALNDNCKEWDVWNHWKYQISSWWPTLGYSSWNHWPCSSGGFFQISVSKAPWLRRLKQNTCCTSQLLHRLLEIHQMDTDINLDTVFMDVKICWILFPSTDLELLQNMQLQVFAIWAWYWLNVCFKIINYCFLQTTVSFQIFSKTRETMLRFRKFRMVEVHAQISQLLGWGCSRDHIFGITRPVWYCCK